MGELFAEERKLGMSEMKKTPCARCKKLEYKLTQKIRQAQREIGCTKAALYKAEGCLSALNFLLLPNDNSSAVDDNLPDGFGELKEADHD